MDDPAFEAHLMRLYAEHDADGDGRDFAAAVERKLARSWALRRSLIGAAGVGGGAIALGQVVASGFADNLRGLSHLAKAAGEGLSALPAASKITAFTGLSVAPEALWLVLGLAVLAIALLAGRSLEDL